MLLHKAWCFHASLEQSALSPGFFAARKHCIQKSFGSPCASHPGLCSIGSWVDSFLHLSSYPAFPFARACTHASLCLGLSSGPLPTPVLWPSPLTWPSLLTYHDASAHPVALYLPSSCGPCLLLALCLCLLRSPLSTTTTSPSVYTSVWPSAYAYYAALYLYLLHCPLSMPVIWPSACVYHVALRLHLPCVPLSTPISWPSTTNYLNEAGAVRLVFPVKLLIKGFDLYAPI